MAKNKTLPKDFEVLLKDNDLEKLKAVFTKCNLDATGGYSKQTALAYEDCSDELAKWLIEQGLSISAPDSRGRTPLQSRAGSWRGRINGLIALGADVNEGDGVDGTALHEAAGAHHEENVRVLLENGARVDAVDKNKMTPLEKSLLRASNATIERAAKVADLLLGAGAIRKPSMPECITRLGTSFEFMRSNFNPDSREATSAALDHLYVLFDVPPVPRRSMHDGKSKITAKSTVWQDQHQALWELLVPGTGAAPTVQGEVIRISGRIARELDGNGGVNWDAQFKQMADAWLGHVQSGASLSATEIDEASSLVKDIKARQGDTERMCELSTAWVLLNANPVALAKPTYER